MSEAEPQEENNPYKRILESLLDNIGSDWSAFGVCEWIRMEAKKEEIDDLRMG